MWIYLIGSMLIALVAASPRPAVAEVTIEGATLAQDVQNREPVGALTAASACESGANGGADVPVLEASASPRIFFWNRLQTDSAGTLRHTWYINRDQGWRETAEVDLSYVASGGYRTWSSKQLDPSLHAGEWKVEVTGAEEPERVLCTIHFRVR